MKIEIYEQKIFGNDNGGNRVGPKPSEFYFGLKDCQPSGVFRSGYLDREEPVLFAIVTFSGTLTDTSSDGTGILLDGDPNPWTVDDFFEGFKLNEPEGFGVQSFEEPKSWEEMSEDEQISVQLKNYKKKCNVNGDAKPTPTATIAEKIAAQFDDDGQCFTDSNGNDLETVCKSEMKSLWCIETEDDTKKYKFKDNSILTVHGNGWDFGFDCCFGLKSGNHSANCENGQPEY